MRVQVKEWDLETSKDFSSIMKGENRKRLDEDADKFVDLVMGERSICCLLLLD